MPRKLYASEPPVIFQELFRAALEDDREFLIRTPDSVYTPWAQELSDEHYPPQSQLPLD